MLADIAEVDAASHERLNIDNERSFRRGRQFAEIARGLKYDLAHGAREASNLGARFRVHRDPFATEIRLRVEILKNRAEIIDRCNSGRNVVVRDNKAKVRRRSNDQTEGEEGRKRKSMLNDE